MERIEEGIGDVESNSELAQEMLALLGSASAKLDDATKYVTSGEDKIHALATEPDAELIQILAEVERAKTLASGIEDYLESVGKYVHAASRLQLELTVLEEELEVTYEAAGLGLVAEAFTHEVANVADRLLNRINSARRYTGRRYPHDHRLVEYHRNLRSSIVELRNQLAHLSPALRYVRKERKRVDLIDVLEETQSYFRGRWSGEPLDVNLVDQRAFSVKSNRGTLLQIFDNLLLNSEYWLRQEIRMGKIERGIVNIELAAPIVVVWDNGPGIAPEIEKSLFRPFTTRKPSGRGRGIGLFVVTKLLQAEGCTIELERERNESGNLFRFAIDLDPIT